ncbi:MAG: 6-phosphogluconolactonase [Elusimicrobia bacterium]|nr:6-phosphogluconolactonase [Elusimicrobiota bacterium]
MNATAPEVRRYEDLETLSVTAAELVAATARAAAAERGRFSLALSGGSTPRRLYQMLAASDLPWERVHLFWGDERCVPREDPASNYRLAREALFARAPLPPANVHPMPCDPAAAEEGAAAYETELREFFSGTGAAFDLVLLGLGPDGHTASLFPGEPTLDESSRWVVCTPGLRADPPVPRLTLTFPALAASRGILLLAAGLRKKSLVEAAARGGADFPAARARARGGALWLWSSAE